MDLEVLRDEASGLFAAVAVDRPVGGVAAGGIRIRDYADEASAVEDAKALARAMTLKAALAGIRCGGAKVVVRADGLRDRSAALELVGRAVDARGGALYVGPDLGFTEDDRRAVARATRFVDGAEVASRTSEATALGLRESIAAALGTPSLRGARIGILGIGKVGGALARLLLDEGAAVAGFDVAPGRVAGAGVEPASESDLLEGELDALAPCAAGGAIDLDRARRLRARALVGAANHLLAPPEVDVARELARRGIVHVPDFLANAGAFVYWANTVLERRSDALARAAVLAIGVTARAVLARAAAEQRTPYEVALALAEERVRGR